MDALFCNLQLVPFNAANVQFVHSYGNIGGSERQNVVGRNINPCALLQLPLLAE